MDFYHDSFVSRHTSVVRAYVVPSAQKLLMVGLKIRGLVV
jgi:hypothetical protein